MKFSLLPLPLFIIIFLIGCSSGSESNEETVSSVNPNESDTIGQDPLIQNTVQMAFEITVPAYQSDELSVELDWGDNDTNAAWIGDEFWSASEEFPTGTENLLTVVFFDRIGTIELGSYEAQFRTGINASEIYTIDADQFNTDRWDADADGISNLNELIAGSDPFANENELLEVRDNALVHSSVFAADSFSTRVPSERPYYYYFEDITPVTEGGPSWGGPISREIIDIDENGNGSFFDLYQERPLVTNTQTANRANTGDSITWEGAQINENALADVVRQSIRFTTQISVVDESTRTYVGESDWQDGNFATYTMTSNKQSEYNLTGTVSEDTMFCIPIAGTIVTIYSTFNSRTENDNSSSHVRKTISKESTDPYWKVTIVEIEDELVVAEYYARSIRFEHTPSEPSPTFKCEFVDL